MDLMALVLPVKSGPGRIEIGGSWATLYFYSNARMSQQDLGEHGKMITTLLQDWYFWFLCSYVLFVVWGNSMMLKVGLSDATPTQRKVWNELGAWIRSHPRLRIFLMGIIYKSPKKGLTSIGIVL